LRAYLSMAGIALGVFVGVQLASDPKPRGGERPGLGPEVPVVGASPSGERDFLTTVLAPARVVHADPYCDPQGCCPTRLTTFGTTAPTKDVITAFEVQGYLMQRGGHDVRGGPFPPARWTADLDLGSRWEWRRVEVARGADVDRPAWPTIFARSSVACGQG
jgi:hypothetical protein